MSICEVKLISHDLSYFQFSLQKVVGLCCIESYSLYDTQAN